MAEEQDLFKEFGENFFKQGAVVFADTFRSLANDFQSQIRDEADAYSKSLLRDFKNQLNSIGRNSQVFVNIQEKLSKGALKQKDITKESIKINQKINELFTTRQLLLQNGVNFTDAQKEAFQNSIDLLEKEKKTLNGINKIQEDVNKKLGAGGRALTTVGKILKSIGIDNSFANIVDEIKDAETQLALNNIEIKDLEKFSKNLTDAEAKRLELLKDENEELKKQTSILTQTKESLKSTFSLVNLQTVALTALAGSLVKGFLTVNKAYVDFSRQTGRIIKNVEQFNENLLLTSEYINQAVTLTQQFGLAADLVFSQENISGAAELTALMGMTAEEANNFALISQVGGDALNENVQSLIRQVGQLNVQNKTAVSQRTILNDISNVSKTIGAVFASNTKELVNAATQARALGLNLEQVDKIADSLLDIETSLENRFAAQAVTGRELNLQAATYFALTNETDKLVEEIGKNQAVINAFATDNRIEQELVAAALGLSKEELAEMYFTSLLNSKVTAEQARLTAGLSEEDFKRLTVQQQIARSIQTIGESVAPVLEFFASLVSNTQAFYTVLTAIGAMSFARTIGQLVSMNATLVANAIAAGATSSALSLGLAIPSIIAGVALLGGYLASEYAKAKQNATNVGDLQYSPGDTRPRISLVEGGLRKTYVGTNNDAIDMSPDAGRGRNSNVTVTISDAQMEKLGNKVAMAVSRATVSVNPNALASNLQVSQVMEQREFSI